MSDNQTQNAPHEDPLQTLVAQVKMLDENIGNILKSGATPNEVIEDYLCPILHAMGVAVEQSFAAINQVAHTANFALITSEKTLAGDSLTQVADIVNEAEASIQIMASKIPPELEADFNNLKDLLNEATEVIGPWMSGESDEDNDIDEDTNNSNDLAEAHEEVEAELVDNDSENA